MPQLQRAIGLLVVGIALSTAAHADEIDDYVRAQMKKRHIPGLSLAVIQDGKVIDVRAYGVRERGKSAPVTTDTLFQAGSISKSVSATGALRLVEQGKLSLDEDVNAKLASWKVPDNDYTKQQKVTLRRLLSHTAGLTVHGFGGYAVDAPRPTLIQVLNGEPPANSPPIRVDVLPGSLWRYSGGGYTIMQLLIGDVTGRPFPEFMQEMVLGPAGMKSSSYQQPLPDDRARLTACGHTLDGVAVKGRWHIYPEMAAAGLWTTPSDLARFAIALQECAAGRRTDLISQSTARQMLTDQKDGDGLGVFLASKGHTLRFTHSGRDEGFDALLVAYAETGQGAAVMINANENSNLMDRITQVIAKKYHWPDYPNLPPQTHTPVRVDGRTLADATGYYEMFENAMLTLKPGKGRLIADFQGGLMDELLPASKTMFYSDDPGVEMTLVRNAAGEVTGLALHAPGGDRNIPRLAPLLHTLAPKTDPDPARTQRLQALLQARAPGGKSITDQPGIAPGFLKDFAGNGADPALAGLQTLTYLGESRLTERNVTRHGGKVERILYYRRPATDPYRYLLVHLTADGLLTDYDAVND